MKKIVLVLIFSAQMLYAQNNCSVDHYRDEIDQVLEQRVEQMKAMLVQDEVYPNLVQVFQDKQDTLRLMFDKNEDVHGNMQDILKINYSATFADEGYYHTLEMGLVSGQDSDRHKYSVPIHFLMEATQITVDKTKKCRFRIDLAQQNWEDQKKVFVYEKIEGATVALFANKEPLGTTDDPIISDLMVFAEPEQISDNVLPYLKQSPSDAQVFIDLPYNPEAGKEKRLTNVIQKKNQNKRYCPENAKSAPCLMGYADAKNYCEKHHAGMPTIKDIAMFYNPLGVLSSPDNSKMPVFKEKAETDFYYTNEDFPQYINTEEQGRLVWSSSNYPYIPMKMYVFDIDTANITVKLAGSRQYVICLQKADD